MSKMGFEKLAQMATHILEAGQGRRQCEQDGIGETGCQAQMATHILEAGWGEGNVSKLGLEEQAQTASNSQTESRAGKKVM